MKSLLYAAAILLFVACGGRSADPADGEAFVLEYARGFTVEVFDGYTKVQIKNPWDTAKLLRTYLLVPDSLPLPGGLPPGEIVRTPVRRIVAYASAHCGMLEAIGAERQIVGVCEPRYVNLDFVKRGLADGTPLVLAVLFLANLFFGSVRLPFGEVWHILLGGEASRSTWEYIVLQSRLPQAVTALFAGAALVVAGLMLQTLFNNPLASPSLLGITNGASLGVAVVMLLAGGTIGGSTAAFTLSGNLAVVAGAFLGAMAVLALLLLFSLAVRSNVMLLIIGLMVGYLASSVIALLNFFATAEGVFHYTIWGMGDFSGVAVRHLPFFCTAIFVGLLIGTLLVKPMNALLLGERYAANLGIDVRYVRIWMLAATGLLVAVATAFCGPVAFIGLAVPHIVRLLTGTSDHHTLMPLTILTGGIVALLCNLITALPPDGVIPLNAVTPLVGAPVMIYVILNRKQIQYFQ